MLREYAIKKMANLLRVVSVLAFVSFISSKYIIFKLNQIKINQTTINETFAFKIYIKLLCQPTKFINVFVSLDFVASIAVRQTCNWYHV